MCADYLYWKTYQDNLEYGANVAVVNDGTNSTINSTLLAPQYDANNGFKVFADIIYPNSCWQIGATYTRISSKVGNSTAVNPATIDSHFIVLNSQRFPVFTAFTSNNINLSSLKSSFTSTLNYLDLDIAREINLGFFDITPHMGLRGLWLRQKLALDGFAPDTTTAPGFTIFSNFTEQLDGYGLEAGFDADLKLWYGFSVVGKLGGSLLYARVNVHETVSGVSNTTAAVTSINASDTIYHLCPTVDGFIGLQYVATCFCYPFELHAGWEQHLIVNANRFSVFDYADLTLQGLTVGGSVRF